tara:strand:- start:809 stop:1660 length:852 start_codon:yes stop_codon:yes gene_type:complete
MSRVLEFFGRSTKQAHDDWPDAVSKQTCPFLGKRCYKVRKSDPETSIGTCSVSYGKPLAPVLICPTRLIEKRKIFTDCLHLLTSHEPGNDLHIVSEVAVPGGSVDYFLVSATGSKVKDFVGIELQTLDTTGTVWPERQRLLRDLDIPRIDEAENTNKPFGMNWKMTAKTILVQMHHKLLTFEHVNRKLVLVVQDRLLEYMEKEFNFDHLNQAASLGDPMHFHAYSVSENADKTYRLNLAKRLSTDETGIAACLGLQAEARVELAQIIGVLEKKISDATLFTPA